MKVSGWIFMAASWLLIVGLFAFSMARTLSRTGARSQEEDSGEGNLPGS